ncbi:MAG: class I SAM-dependent methyltransferase [Muribaculaceae bacterium]|nr:class I SAM-dependent methyltransferase [Muribaculaceae bacterium]
MNTDFFTWIQSHINDDPALLRLKYAGKSAGDFDTALAITQIECRKKFSRKLGQTLAAFPHFVFPNVLSGEQSTSDLLASFHSSLIPSGLDCADLTAGLGIDALKMASRAASVVAVERQKELADALVYNAAGLHVDNIEVVNGDCNDFVDKCISEGRRFGAVFIDPARRAADGSRVFGLADCEPDVVAMMERLGRICRLLVIKASPMLDISHTAGELDPKPLSVVAAGTPTECKEVLAIVDFESGNEHSTVIEAVTLGRDGASTFAFTADEERLAPMPSLGELPKEGGYIYEPWPSLMKAGAYRLIAQRYGLDIFHRNTRLFHSADRKEEFPGTAWRILRILPYASRVIKRFAREFPAANVAVRNFGMSADALRSRLGVRDAGPVRVYGLTGPKDERLLVVTEPA